MHERIGLSPVPSIVAAFIKQDAARIRRDPEFARWLLEEYRPIAGGWQY